MDAQSSAGPPQVESKQNLVEAAANFVNRGDYGTLILDRLGRILSCGAPAERIFRTNQVRLIDHLISDFVAGLFPGESSPSDQQACLVDSCVDGEWRRFVARDPGGQAFAVELKLVRVITPSPDREMFLLNVRRPGPRQDGCGRVESMR